MESCLFFLPGERGNLCKIGLHFRKNSDIEAYNEVAIKVVTKYGFEVNDLHSLLKDVPESYHSDCTHYYTPEATRLISNKVIECISNALEITPKTLDYDDIFMNKKDIVGI